MPPSASLCVSERLIVVSTACYAKHTASSPTTLNISSPVSMAGPTSVANLALARHRCNLRKGPNLTAIDPLTLDVVPLFHPRSGNWSDHCLFESERIIGLTAVG